MITHVGNVACAARARARLHVGRLVEGHGVGRNFDVRLQALVKVPRAVAVPEERDLGLI